MKNSIVTISHDPFGRYGIVRTPIKAYTNFKEKCTECGQPAKFYYGIWRDDHFQPEINTRHPFCGIECWRAYTNNY